MSDVSIVEAEEVNLSMLNIQLKSVHLYFSFSVIFTKEELRRVKLIYL